MCFCNAFISILDSVKCRHTRACLLTKSADVASAVDCLLERRGYCVGVRDDGDLGGLVVDLGASSHCPRRMKLPVNAAYFDAEGWLTTLRVGVVELNQMKTTTRVEYVLAQQKLRPGTNLASIQARGVDHTRYS